MKCRWYNRWYHQRLREIDMEMLLPAFQLKAEDEANRTYLNGTYQWYEYRDGIVDGLFDLHKSLPGQEHWRCECSINFKN